MVKRSVAAAAGLGAAVSLVTACSTTGSNQAVTPTVSEPQSASASSTPTFAKVVAFPDPMPGEIARLEFDIDVMSSSAGHAEPGVRYAAYAACSRSDPDATFRYSIFTGGRRRASADVACNGHQITNTALAGDEGGGKVRIRFVGIASSDSELGSSQAYVVVAPGPA